MPDTIRPTDYFYTMAPDTPGEGARLLRVFRDAGVNFLAFSAFPSQRKSQVDFVPADSAAFLAAAKAAKIRLKPRKTVFLIEGEDRVGAIEDILRRLGEAKINVTAIDAVTTSGGRFGALLWVKQRQVKKAAAKAAKIRLKPRKTVFLIEGEDRVGAIEGILRRLGEAKINVTAIDAVTTSGGRFGALLWVNQRQVKKAAQVLGV